MTKPKDFNKSRVFDLNIIMDFDYSLTSIKIILFIHGMVTAIAMDLDADIFEHIRLMNVYFYDFILHGWESLF
ncbi:hypothetical protein [Geminocystis herdmanii]|uniref:hypothetical protein n=1 Tax=Geminocystis herdmanii TaxID=669359 RepID=UPI0003681125|nr:hypothetical protein [Geminocystis herdmanii]